MLQKSIILITILITLFLQLTYLESQNFIETNTASDSELLLIQADIIYDLGQNITIDTDLLNKGLVSVVFDERNNTMYKLIIKKGTFSQVRYLHSGAVYPITDGNGMYEIILYQQLRDSFYKRIYGLLFNYQNDEIIGNDLYLASVYDIEWNDEMLPVIKARELTNNISDDHEKALVIYNHILQNFTYDYTKVTKLNKYYSPDAALVYEEGSGICFDFASLYAVMLRSVDVPTKLVKGYNSKMIPYHAWNEVYIESLNQWLTVDTTHDINEYRFYKKKPAKTIEDIVSDYGVYDGRNRY